MSAPRTACAIARAERFRAILDLASHQSPKSVRRPLRAPDRPELDMASSAVYRYFPSRDALLTALIVEGYDDLGGRAAEAADSAVDDRIIPRGPLALVAHGARLGPRAAALPCSPFYGSPVPGYAAPQTPSPPRPASPDCSRSSATPSRRACTLPALLLVLPVEAAGPAGRHHKFLPAVSDDDRPAPPRGPLSSATSRWSLFGHMHRGVLDYDVHFCPGGRPGRRRPRLGLRPKPDRCRRGPVAQGRPPRPELLAIDELEPHALRTGISEQVGPTCLARTGCTQNFVLRRSDPGLPTLEALTLTRTSPARLLPELPHHFQLQVAEHQLGVPVDRAERARHDVLPRPVDGLGNGDLPRPSSRATGPWPAAATPTPSSGRSRPEQPAPARCICAVQ